MLKVCAIDLRGHGNTITSADEDLSINTLTQDVISVITTLYPSVPPVILAGHSLGGAVAVHVAAARVLPIAGLVVVDVVEGTALKSLATIPHYLSTRPPGFASVEQGIEWAVRSQTIRHLGSARASFAAQLAQTKHQPQPRIIPYKLSSNSSSALSLSPSMSQEKEKNDHKSQTIPVHISRPDTRLPTNIPNSPNSSNNPTSINVNISTCPPAWTWRVDLIKSQQYWEGWFRNMSELFLSAPCHKCLLVSGTDRLDTPLTIAHMQGKFQLKLVTSAGHCVHEDAPDKVGAIMLQFASKLPGLIQFARQNSAGPLLSPSRAHLPVASGGVGVSGNGGRGLGTRRGSSSRALPSVPRF